MANLVRNFIKGRMNKSVDERLVPDGEYIDAQNIRMGSTEDSEIGAVENTKGNEQLTTLVYPPTGDALSADATCIGSYADGAEETIYWFVHDPNFTAVGATGKLDMIVSYNTRTGTLVNHVVSIEDPTDPTNTRTTLNFDPQYLITGVDLVEDLLFFTDDYNPPRRINVTKAYPQPSAPTHVDSGLLEDDILVIKRPPNEAPTYTTSHDGSQNDYMEDRLICFGYRYRYEDGEYSATSQFTDPAFVSKPFDFTPEAFLNEGMENAINTCQVTVRTGSALVTGIDILFKEMDDSIIRVIERVDKADAALSDNSDYTITFNNSKIFTILPESEILRLYDNVPRLAKAQTMMGNRLVYGNYLEGYDLIDENDQPIKFGYQVNHMKGPVGNSVASIATTNTKTYTLPGIATTPTTVVKVEFDEFNLIEGDSFTLTITSQADTPNWYPAIATTPTSATPLTTIQVSYTLTETFDSVADMAASASFLATVGTAGNIETSPANFASSDQSIWTNAWNAMFPLTATGGTPASMPLTGTGISAIAQPAEVFDVTASSFSVAFPMPEYNGSGTNYYELLISYSGTGTSNDSSISLSNLGPRPSLHSNRSYELGIVYMDEYGRSSTALVNQGNGFHINCGESIFRNYAQVQIPAAMRAPYWATRYKFVIKPDAEGYETIYSNIVEEFGGHSYFLLEGENAAKVEKGDRYIVKSDASGPVTTCTYATVLEKEALGVGALDDSVPASPVPAVSGTYMKILPDFNATQSSLNNLLLGEQQAGTNGGSDQSTENGPGSPGDYPVLKYSGFDLDSIPAGSRISLSMNFSRQGRGDALCETRTLDFERTWTVDEDYTDIIDWFYGQDSVIAEIEGVSGYSGDPAIDAPTNNVNDETTNPPDDVSTVYGLTPNGLVNQMCFHRDTTGATDVISFIIVGTNKCSGGFGSGSSPNRRSIVKAKWSIVRASDDFVFETEPTDALPDLWYESSQSFPIVTDPDDVRRYRGNAQNQTSTLPAIIDTSFFNCISYGNGVESYKIRDSISGKPIGLGNRVTTVSEQDYKEIRRFADLTYSGVYNDETNLNKLNEFNLGLLNFKPLEDSYGPVEKLFGRRTDILTLQEDKISYVLAGKNLLTDSTGESVVASVPEVLGTQVARVEDYGISNNPESFAQWGPHKFFTDAKRGAVIHLFGDGQNEQLEVISENGMRSWFRDMFIGDFNTQKLGGYDPYMDEYVLASNEVALPGETDCIECNTVQSFLLTASGESYCVDLGNVVGNTTVSYNVIEATGADSAVITASYNGADTDSGSIGNGSSGSFTINKDEVDVAEANISIAFTGTERFVVQVTVSCPTVTELTVVLATLSQPDAQRQTIHSEYQWSDGSFVSPLSSTPVTFQYGAAAPIVSSWVEVTGAQGSNLVPTDGSDITMIYNRIFPDNYTIRPEDRFHLLRTNTRYTESQITNIINDGDLITVTPSGAQPEYTGDFTMPSTGQYLYLVWNYTDVAPASALLDTYPGAATAYSVRLLSSTYSGSALRVRRTVAPFDEQDIGFDSGGELDTAAIAAFGGSDALTISVWYDQSGNANNASQSTATSQPQIYDGTAVVTENSKPALDFNFNGTPSSLTLGSQLTGTAGSLFTTITRDNRYNKSTFMIIGSKLQNTHYGYNNSAAMYDHFASTTRYNWNSVISLYQQLIYSVVSKSGSWTAEHNGSNVFTSGTNTVGYKGSGQIIGNATVSSGEGFSGRFQEIIIYTNDQTANRSGITTDINTYFSVY